MSSKPFISARIPEDLLNQVETRSDATGESKSRILIDALEAYLNPEADSSKHNVDIETLGKRLSYFEKWIEHRVAVLEDQVNALKSSKGYSLNPERTQETLPAAQRKSVNMRRLMPSSQSSGSAFDEPTIEA